MSNQNPQPDPGEGDVWLGQEAPGTAFPTSTGDWLCELCGHPIYGPVVGLHIFDAGSRPFSVNSTYYGCLDWQCAHGVVWGRNLFRPITGEQDYKVGQPFGWPNRNLLTRVAMLRLTPWPEDQPRPIETD